IVVDDEIEVLNALDRHWDFVSEREARVVEEEHLIPRKEDLFLTPQETLDQIRSFSLFLLDHLDLVESSLLSSAEPEPTVRFHTHAVSDLSIRLKTKVGSGNALQPLVDAILRWRDEGYAIALVAGSESRAERLHRRLLEADLHPEVFIHVSGREWEGKASKHPFVILQGHLSSSVAIVEDRKVYISERDIFGERSYRTQKQQAVNIKRLMGSLSQLEEGDFVVHIDYGIGRYAGLRHRQVDGKGIDLVKIEYADSVLYLPVHKIGRIQRFVGAEGKTPTLDKLGSTRWAKTKRKVREDVVTLACELIKLYASRSIMRVLSIV